MSDTVQIMYNACYGGFGFSDLAKEEYCKLCPGATDIDNIERHDPVMVQIVLDLGPERAGARFAKIELEEIPSRYVNHYSILEYDGMETVRVRYNKYKLDYARLVLQNKELLSQTEQLECLSAILNQDDDE
jgi:hypothetical protein